MSLSSSCLAGLLYVVFGIVVFVVATFQTAELPGRLGAWAGRLTQVLAAPVTFCISLFLVLLNVLLVSFVVATFVISLRISFFEESPLIDGALVECFIALMSLWAGVAVARLSSFMFPRVLGSLANLRRWPSVCAMILAHALVFWFLVSMRSSVPRGLVYFAVFLLPLANAHRVRLREGSVEDSLPFVLFLRRFSGVGERVVLGSILKAARRGMAVAVLRDQGNRAVGWDPLLLGLSGIRLREILGHAPRCFVAPHDSWEAAVRTLAHRARWIVADISEPSDSIKLELGLLGKDELLGKTIFVESSEVEPSCRVLETCGLSLEETGARLLRYREKWSLFGLAVVLFEGGLLFFPLVVATVYMDRIGHRPSELFTASVWLLAYFYFVAFFWKPRIDRTFLRDLRRRFLEMDPPPAGGGSARISPFPNLPR